MSSDNSGSELQLSKARLLLETGRLDEARVAYRDLRAAHPNDIDVLLDSGVAEAHSGDLSAARNLFEQAQRLAPDDISVHFNLAELEREAGNLTAAELHFRICATQYPDDVDALLGLGDVLRGLQRFEQAEAALSRAATLAPQDAEVLNALALVYEATSRPKRAVACYRKAVQIDPGTSAAGTNLALALSEQGQYGDACEVFAATAKSAALDGNGHLAWAVAELSVGREENAAALVSRALDAGGDSAFAHEIKGLIHQRLGRFCEAATELERAIAEDPTRGSAYKHLADMNLLAADAVPALDALLHDASVEPNSRAAAGYALFQLHDRLDQTDDAAKALESANGLKRKLYPFNRERYEKAAADVVGYFSRELLIEGGPTGLADVAPIFIVGMPRSGTTLVEQILAHYDGIIAGGERADIHEFVSSLNGYPAVLSNLETGWAEAAARHVHEATTDQGKLAGRPTNKSPGNDIHCGLIGLLFPNAKIVYCQRDPRDIGLSTLAQDFHSNVKFAYDQDDFALAYRRHELIMNHWKQVLPIDIHTVSYEQLAGDPANAARALVDYCGLHWDEACIDTHKVKRPVHTASVWQVRQPINVSSVGKWERYADYLQPMIRALGMS
jgi:tetratricopeptide (TPR) repeat protein